MIKPPLMLLGIFLFCAFAPLASAGEPQKREISPFFPMRNKDVLVLVAKKLTVDEIIEVIRISWCNFDTFPPVLQDLKQRGVSGQILQAMVDAPYGPPSDSMRGTAASQQPIYHSAEQLKQLGFLTLTPVTRGEQGFTADRRGPGGIMRQ